MIASPCNKVCRMEGGVCAGCFRTLDEIGRWSTAGEAEKQSMLAAAAQRRGRVEAEPSRNRGD